jgi:hypothetical protein
MSTFIQQLAQRLSQNVEAVCAYYLSNGHKNGRYWIIGDVMNTPGRSMWVRLAGPASGPGRVGKWTDAATGEFGDLLDLIRLNRNLTTTEAVVDEAMAFLSEPRHMRHVTQPPAPRNSQEAARRLFAGGKSVIGTPAETYLRSRGITTSLDTPALRYHPSCYYRGSDTSDLQKLPALLAAVTDTAGAHTGLLKTFLASDGRAKAFVTTPKVAMGNILGHGVRIGDGPILAAGEGVETMLSLRSLLPRLPVMAAVSAGHLGAIELPAGLRRLYIAYEPGLAGKAATERLTARAFNAGIDVAFLMSTFDDWNTDHVTLGHDEALARLLPQLADEDRDGLTPR